MDITHIETRTALVRSRIPGVEYVVNPYLGCGHGCRYCYAVFMRRYSNGHQDRPWGSFVEVKVNIAEVLRAELQRKRRPARAMLASVCDPYQPVEGKYGLTRRCLLALRDFGWGLDLLTRSPLVTRDLDLLAAMPGCTVGFSIPTDDDRVRRVTEPQAPPIAARLAALRRVHEAGVSTWVFVAPMLPMNPARLHELVSPHADRVMWDPLNYRRQVQGLFRRQGWERFLSDSYARETGTALSRLFRDEVGVGKEAPGAAAAKPAGGSR